MTLEPPRPEKYPKPLKIHFNWKSQKGQKMGYFGKIGTNWLIKKRKKWKIKMTYGRNSGRKMAKKIQKIYNLPFRPLAWEPFLHACISLVRQMLLQRVLMLKIDGPTAGILTWIWLLYLPSMAHKYFCHEQHLYGILNQLAISQSWLWSLVFL